MEGECGSDNDDTDIVLVGYDSREEDYMFVFDTLEAAGLGMFKYTVEGPSDVMGKDVLSRITKDVLSDKPFLVFITSETRRHEMLRLLVSEVLNISTVVCALKGEGFHVPLASSGLPCVKVTKYKYKPQPVAFLQDILTKLFIVDL